jgi:hypothetical protein
VFARASSGKLTQLPGSAGCINSDGSDGCTPVRGPGIGCCGLAVSPEPRNLYGAVTRVGSFGLTVFSRETGSGALTQLAGAAGCLNTEASDGCARVAFRGDAPENVPGDIAISPNGRDVYLSYESIFEGAEGALCGAEEDFVALFHRDAAGALDPFEKSCGRTRRFDGPVAIALTSHFAYIIGEGSEVSSVVDVFGRSVR